MAVPTLLSWSSGKDSAWALHVLRADPGVELVGLVTTVNERHARVAMHAVRLELLRAQAAACALPLSIVALPDPCANEDYERLMGDFVAAAVADGVAAMAFGDLFLEDVRAYRERNLAGTGLDPVFPLWGRPTAALAREMVAAGLRARVTCVDPKQLSPDFVGRVFDESYLDDLPPGVDPCGENGEFHSFAYAGPMFDREIDLVPGDIVERGGFAFADLLPAGAAYPPSGRANGAT